jgi:hypothetical protein
MRRPYGYSAKRKDPKMKEVVNKLYKKIGLVVNS